MSELAFIEQLLDGVEVEWKALGDVALYASKRIEANQVTEDNYVGVDNLVQNRGGKVNSSYVPMEGRLIGYEPGDVLIGNIRPYLKKIWLADHPGGTNGDVLVIRPNHAALDSRYMHQALTGDNFFEYNMQHAKGAKMPRGDKAKILDYIIPIPCPDNPKKSLEIQAEIVRILDAFTAVTSELTSELTKRNKQYKYYRDQLLRFEEGEVEWKSLGQIGKFIRGKRFTKADYVEDGIPAIHYGEIYTHYVVWTDKVKSQVRPDMVGTLRYAKPGDVVITDVGETVEDVGKAVAWIGDDEVAIHDHCYAFRHEMNPKFVSYCMQTSSFVSQKAKYVARTKVNTLLIDGFSKIRIPVPSIEEQARIVAILDKFDALVNDLSSGLPAEIKARRQQYEHYRDLLLSFPKSQPQTAAHA